MPGFSVFFTKALQNAMHKLHDTHRRQASEHNLQQHAFKSQEIRYYTKTGEARRRLGEEDKKVTVHNCRKYLTW